MVHVLISIIHQAIDEGKRDTLIIHTFTKVALRKNIPWEMNTKASDNDDRRQQQYSINTQWSLDLWAI
jgi:hypothetical protein